MKADRDESSPYAAMLASQDVAVRCKVLKKLMWSCSIMVVVKFDESPLIHMVIPLFRSLELLLCTLSSVLLVETRQKLHSLEQWSELMTCWK